MKKLIFLIVLVFFTSGCSVFMSMHGKKEPNLSILTVGQNRGIVTLNLGNPVQTYIKDDMIVDIYEVQFGNEPSGGRATGHAVMDLITLGGWELIGTPIEATQGKTQTITIEYDKNNKLVSVNTVQGSPQRTPKEETPKEQTPAPTTNFETN